MLLHYFNQARRSTRKALLIFHITWQVSPDFCLFRNFWKEKRSQVSPPTQPNFLVFGKFHFFDYMSTYVLELSYILDRRISKITTRQTRNVCKCGE